MPQETSIGGDQRAFEPTAWTLIFKARDERGFGALVECYWKPCYFYIRRKGHDIEDAKDLAQGFFMYLLERDALARVTKSKGRFRSFLLACLDHYLADERDRRQAKKRAVKPLPLDFAGAESELALAKPDDPERAYRRRWALEIMDRALGLLHVEMGERFHALREYITVGQPTGLRDLAAKLALTESNIKVLLHRARRRYGDLVRAEIARTVEEEDDVEAELNELFEALA